MKKRTFLAMSFIVSAFFTASLGAEEPVRIQSKGSPGIYIHVEQPQPEAGMVQAGWLSAQWLLEPVPGENFFRIRNAWRNTSYLHIENGNLEAGQILPGWFSAQWFIEQTDDSYVRFRNRWQPDHVINNQNGSLNAGPINPQLAGSEWLISPVNAPDSSPASVAATAQKTQPPQLPVNDMRLFQPQHNGTVGMMLIRYTDQIRTMMDLQVKPGDKVYFFPQRLPDANRNGISFNPDKPEICAQTFIVEEVSPKIVFDRPMPMIRNRNNDTFSFVVEVYR